MKARTRLEVLPQLDGTLAAAQARLEAWLQSPRFQSEPRPVDTWVPMGGEAR